MFKNALLAGLAGVFAIAIGIPASQADVFNVAVWQGTCTGNTVGCAAGPGNTNQVGATFNTLLATGTYTSNVPFVQAGLAFNTGGAAGTTGTIGQFWAAGNGTASASLLAIGADTMTTLGSGLQTEFIFTDQTALPGPKLVSITHDDGVQVFLSGHLIINNPNPTTAVTDTATTTQGGVLQVFYVASNGLPEVLNMSAVPLPATVWLFGAGLGGIGLLMRRRRNKGSALAAV
jgi:hypothetical protein